MRISFLLIALIILIACNSSSKHSTPSENSDTTTFEEKSLIKDTTIEVVEEEAKPSYPSPYCLDSSWRVFYDNIEGFFISYTVKYPSGKDTTVMFDESVPVIGAIDHPGPYYVDSVTYLIPNIGSSKNGYFQLYIYKDGTCKYVEKVLR